MIDRINPLTHATKSGIMLSYKGRVGAVSARADRRGWVVEFPKWKKALKTVLGSAERLVAGSSSLFLGAGLLALPATQARAQQPGPSLSTKGLPQNKVYYSHAL